MTACETCWSTAYRIAKMTGRDRAEVYWELVKANAASNSHDEARAEGLGK